MTTYSQSGPPVFCQWEIWHVDWEHEDGTVKARPCLVLSSTSAAALSGELWVAKFTKTCSNVPFRIEFSKSDPSFRETGLSETCYLYVAEARKIDKSRFLYKRGKLPLLSSLMMGLVVKQALKFKIP